jgi:hypothetical protein
VILPNVIKYWEEIINESSEEDYLFTGTWAIIDPNTALSNH